MTAVAQKVGGGRLVSCHKYNLNVEVKCFYFGSLKDSKLQVVHRDHVDL